MCNVLKRPFLKSLSISDEILNKFGIRCTPEHQRVTSKDSRTMGSERPDKHDKTGFDSVPRGGGWGWGFFSRDNLPSLTVWCGSCKLTGASSGRTPEVTQINWVTAPDIGQGSDPARSPRFGKRMRGSGSFWSWRPYW